MPQFTPKVRELPTSPHKSRIGFRIKILTDDKEQVVSKITSELQKILSQPINEADKNFDFHYEKSFKEHENIALYFILTVCDFDKNSVERGASVVKNFEKVKIAIEKIVGIPYPQEKAENPKDTTMHAPT
jgi:hypothetical protein